MSDYLLKEDASYLWDEDAENILLESDLKLQTNNYLHVQSSGLNVTEKIR